MRFLNLSVHNLGVFRGWHRFDLAPKANNGEQRNLTVVAGHNGTGKTTLFQALMLALYGPLALGDRVSQQAYNDYLREHLHRRSENGTVAISDEGAIRLGFEYVRSGQSNCIEVQRQWRRNHENVLEALTISENGQPLQIDSDNYQAWLNDLLPPGLAAVCFFNAEQLDATASVDRQNLFLKNTLHRLFGLHLAERLQADLRHYIQRQGGERKTDALRVTMLGHQAALDARNAELSRLEEALSELHAQQATLEAALAKQEEQLLAEGGTYAERRPILQEQLDFVKREIERLSHDLREFAAELLPFALVPELNRQLLERLDQEAKTKRRRMAGELWQEQSARISSALYAEDFWQGLELPDDLRNEVIHRVDQALRQAAAPEAPSEQPLIHHLAEPEHEQLKQWIYQALNSVPERATSLGEQLRALREEQRRLEADLQRAPEDGVLASIHAEIQRINENLEKLRRDQIKLSEEIGALRFRRDEESRKYERARKEFEASQASERHLALAQRSRQVLMAYEDALIRQRLTALETALVECFNKLCRKEHLLASVHINPDDFSTELRGADGHVLRLTDFSAGERQLYILALLWAIRQVSGYQLPIAVDTPLARLDAVHRQRLLDNYFPVISDQVLLFATDAELDAILSHNIPLARLYSLYHDLQQRETLVRRDETPRWQGVVLYRGETPDAIRLDGHGGYGETWTTDREHALAYARGTQGKLKQALLPAHVKRLALIDPITGEYDWEAVEVLARLIDDPLLPETLKASSALYDIWREEWTLALRQAGYDSIATHGIEGPEEYVLNPSKLVFMDALTGGEELIHGT